MKADQIKEGYTYNYEVPKFDDTGLQDQWQLETYIFARGVYALKELQCVVDVGCGSGHKLTKLFHDTIIGIEDNQNTLNWLIEHQKREGIWLSHEQYDEFCRGFGEQSAEHNNGVLLICSDVIEHVGDPIEFFEKLVRMPWSDMIISTPTRELGNEPDGPPGNVHHYREWEISEFRDFLEQWNDDIVVRTHCIINPDQRTQMAWLQRKEKGSEPAPETELPNEDGSSSSSSSDLEQPALV